MNPAKAFLVAITALAFSAAPGLADEASCTQAQTEESMKALEAYLTANPAKEEKLPEAATIVEQKYGGEPPVDKRCEALGLLVEQLKTM